jgi:hypothetical protein
MLGRPSSAVLMCENRAAECEVLAALADSPDTERYYLGLAKGWLAHGKDHAFTETVDSMLSRLRNEPEKDGDTDIQATTWRDIIRRCDKTKRHSQRLCGEIEIWFRRRRISGRATRVAERS